MHELILRVRHGLLDLWTDIAAIEVIYYQNISKCLPLILSINVRIWILPIYLARWQNLGLCLWDHILYITTAVNLEFPQQMSKKALFTYCVYFDNEWVSAL